MKSAPLKPRSRNNCALKYSKIHGVIRRHSGLSKLRKPISAFLYSRLLTWANTIEKGLNPPRSFNSVSTVRNRPSGDPNCELFPQGLIIPVPPSTPLYRPVGIDGNNWVVFPGRDAKRKPSNQRVRGLLFPLFRWWLRPAAMPKQYQAVLGSTKTRVQKPVPVIPTLSRPFAVVSFQSTPVGLLGLTVLPPNPAACLRVGVWDKSWDKFANHFETASPQFHFCPGDKNEQITKLNSPECKPKTIHFPL